MPVQAPPTLSPAPPQPAPGNSPVASPVDETPATNDKPTPLLDAALERVAAVTREQRDSLDSPPLAVEPELPSEQTVAPTPSAIAAAEPEHHTTTATLMPPTPQPRTFGGTAGSVPAPAAVLINVTDTSAQPAVRTVANESMSRGGGAKEPEIPAVSPAETIAHKEETQGTRSATQPTNAPPHVAAEGDEPLGVVKLCLCRKIDGFGAFEPLNEPRVKAGKGVLLYCEMTGMTYEPQESSFSARLTSKIEIRSAADRKIRYVWELAPEEDICASRRHDFFVTYRLPLPRNLPPGSYRLYLTQTDLVANRSTSAEIPLEIVR
jgi:hypothetical protein